MDRKSRAIDWDAEAVAMSRHVGTHMFSAHRGAMPWRQTGISVVFGNDDYADDPRSKDEVSKVKDWLTERNIKMLGFGIDPDDGYSWAMLVETSDIRMLNDLVWSSWDDGQGSVSQYQIAGSAIAEYGIEPDHSAN
jgi:hypothetical protein